MKRGTPRTVLQVLRLLLRAPGLLLRARTSFRRFRKSYMRAAAAEGMPEALARGLADGLKPTRVIRALVRQTERDEE